MPTTDPILSAIRAESDTTAEERADFWHNLLTVAVESAAKDTVAHRELLDAVRAERNSAKADRDLAEKSLACVRVTLGIENQRAIAAESERDALRAKVAELEAERTEWIAAAVGVGTHVGHLDPVAGGGTDEIGPREWIWYAQRLGGMVKARIDVLEARPALTVERLAVAMGIGPGDNAAVSAMAKLGPVTLPAQDRAEELARLIWENPSPRIVEQCRAALASLGTPATSPQPADVFAGVSEGDIACIAANAHRECIDGSPWMAVSRAVLARLRVRLVAPVEPDAARRLALAIHAAADAAEES